MTCSIRAPRPDAPRTPQARRARRLAARLALLTLAAPLLAACASDEAERSAAAGWTASGACSEADWNLAGVADAMAGAAPTEGLARIAACPALAGAARIGAEDDYLAGHDEGVARFCTYETGVEMGRARQLPSLSCPAPLAAGFQAGMAAGRAQPEQARPARLPSGEDLEDYYAYAPRIRPWLSIGYGSRGGSGLSWGVGIGF